jgi:hypothetical protein
MPVHARLAALALAAALAAAPVAAQTTDPTPAPKGEIEEGADLLGLGARMILRGLMAEMEPALNEMGLALNELEPVLRDLATLIGDIRNYHPPERMPNGDIILRRKVPLPPPEEGQIDL